MRASDSFSAKMAIMRLAQFYTLISQPLIHETKTYVNNDDLSSVLRYSKIQKNPQRCVVRHIASA